jgi:lipoate-protein ligase B
MYWRWLGRVPFGETVRLQERLREAVILGEGPETVLFAEHDPVITLGRSAEPAHVLAAAAELARRGVELAEASRGGAATYHGPGQLVGYPVIRLRRGVVGHLEALAAAVRQVLAGLGVDAVWRREAPGLWVGDAKICAFGVHVRRRVAMHGFALNVTGALEGFDLIVPCGQPGARTISVARAQGSLGAPTSIPALHLLAARVASALGEALGVTLQPAVERTADPARERPTQAMRSAKRIEMSDGITRMIGA